MNQMASSMSGCQNEDAIADPSGSSPMSKTRLASHPLPTLTGSNTFQFPIPAALQCRADYCVSDASPLKSRVTVLEAQLTTCSLELASSCAELASAKQDLDRDEIIFAGKLEEISALHSKLDQAKAALKEHEVTIAELRHKLHRQDQEVIQNGSVTSASPHFQTWAGLHRSV